MSENLQERSIKSFSWKMAQQVCTLGATFVIQIIMARILDASDFGIVALTTVFMTLANTIIETSFSSAVIQRASVDDQLLSSIFYSDLLLSVLVYLALFFIAEPVALFYENDLLSPILRIQGLRVIFSAFYSIQAALLARKMQFRKIFIAYLIGAVVQGVSGIGMAKMGYGVWALVISTLLNYTVSGFVIAILAKWHPKLFFSYKLVRSALSYSSKVLLVNIIRKLFYNVRKIAMGKVYDEEVLGLFDKGFQFPSTVMTIMDGSLTQVAFTSLSKLQNDKAKLAAAARKYIQLITYFTTPMMLGMAMVAKPMVVVLLTEKWVESVPYVQIVCLTNLFLPLLINTQAFNALGKSEISLKLNIGRFILSVVLLACCIPLSAHMMVFSGFVSNLLFHIWVGIEAHRQFGYRYRDQLADFFLPVTLSLPMCFCIWLISLIPMSTLLSLITEILAGIIVYLGISLFFKNRSLSFVLGYLKKIIGKRRSNA